MNQISPEQLLVKIGLLVMEVDMLRAELGKLQQRRTQQEKTKKDIEENKNPDEDIPA